MIWIPKSNFIYRYYLLLMNPLFVAKIWNNFVTKTNPFTILSISKSHHYISAYINHEDIRPICCQLNTTPQIGVGAFYRQKAEFASLPWYCILYIGNLSGCYSADFKKKKNVMTTFFVFEYGTKTHGRYFVALTAVA